MSNGFFFTEYKRDDEFSYTNKPKAYFLNIKRMSEVSKVGDKYWSTPSFENEFINISKKGDSDGIQFIREKDNKRIIVAYYPNQIKLADGSNTTFDANNPDIRCENGGEVDKFIEDGIVELKMYDTTNDHSKIYGFDAEKPLYIQTIIVSKEHRGKGIGSKVMEYIVDYANKNGHDVIFGNITQKAEPNIDVIKSMIVKSGFNTIEGNDDFYKVMNKDVSETGQDIKCRRCGWQWNTSQSEEFDKYVCHNCGFDNRTFYDTDPIGYKDGGELTNACIEEVVNIINSIQEVKYYYIVNRKLVILFQEELMVYSVEKMNYHLGEFTICHDIVDPEIKY